LKKKFFENTVVSSNVEKKKKNAVFINIKKSSVKIQNFTEIKTPFLH
jgi:hypothetical protein